MSNTILKLKLKRIDPVKYATVAAVLTVLMVLIIFVPFMLLFSIAGAGTASDSLGAGAAIFGGGIFMIILLPIIYGVMVFILTLISTSLLNFVLKKTGGIDIDFEKTGLEISQIGQDRLEQ